MYKKYCCTTRSPPGGGGAIPESARMGSRACNTVWLTTTTPSACGTTTTSTQLVPVTASSQIPFVDVGNTPASVTTALRANGLSLTASDPYNPATRFSQYFPPAPPAPVCPERLPNPVRPRTTPCLPNRRAMTSKEAADAGLA